MGDRLYIKSLPHAELSGVAALVDTREGKISARRLSKNEVLEITLFAVDNGRELAVPAGAGGAMIQVLEGEVLIRSGKAETISGAGSVKVLPMDTGAVVAALQRSKILLTAVLQPDIIGIDEDG